MTNQIDSLIDRLGDEIEEEQEEDDEAFNENSNATQTTAVDPEKEVKFERLKASAQESIAATEQLINSESIPKELTGEDAQWLPPQYGVAIMPSYSADQIERICQVSFDLSQFNCDSAFLNQAFQLEPVELQLETVRENDLNRSALSLRKKRKKSGYLTKSGKKALAKAGTDKLTDNLLTNYLVKQDTDRAAPASALLSKTTAKRPT